jgi:serine/threonine protein kinase/tetratricopeptide (TPR) repeat protein
LHLTPGTRLGAYEIVAPLGSGGMGEVYRAHDVRVDRDVAIKVLPQSLARDADARARLVREAKAVAAISHPNVLALYEFEEEGGFAYAVTELLEGETLRAVFNRGPMPWRRAVEIGAAIADGLAAAHAKNIIHRDLKPENVFITDDGRVKILDFGLARSRPAPAAPLDDLQPTAPLLTGDFESDRTVIGTVGYMSPEQLRAEVVTPAADLFSLGCILYEAVTGRGAFRSATAIDTMTAVLRDELPPLTDSGHRVPFELDRIIRRCVEKSPAARFQSAGDLAFALRALGSGAGAIDVPLPVSRRRRKPSLWWLALLIPIVAAIVLTRRPARNAPIQSLAVLPFANDTSNPANEYLSDGITESLINDLSRVPDLAVVSRTSVFRYKGKDVSPQTAARELKVQAVLTGRIIRPRDELVISTELIDGRTNRHLWGQQFRTRLDDLATAQAKISREIAEQLRLELSGAAREQVSRPRTGSGEAYRLYLHGRYELNKRTGGAFQRAIRYFREAIARDPNYALAYAGLADCYILQSIYNEAPPSTVLPLAREAASRALQLDETLAEAHTSLAYFEMNFGSDLQKAVHEFERAIELNPSYATAHQWYSRCLVEMQRYDEAIREIRRAEQLDPLSLIIIAELGGVYADAGRLDEAVTECSRALALEPEFAFGHYVLAGAYLKQRRFDDAAREAMVAWELGRDPRSLVRVGLSEAAAGDLDSARAILERLEQLSRERFVSSYALATLLAATGRKDDAFARLQRAASELPPGQYQRLLRNDPLLAPLRSDPRYASLRVSP